ncbi:MAG: Gfo/Idh/MocA family oxidoreductase [Acidobacteria bacterium]|nr:MAG: Gfo/Idh/MocA family oxidoreductase [Acidobacteriota bacterium]
MVTKPKPKRVRWGVLGVAKIATEKVIPAMQQCKHARISAIASRSLETAERAAKALKIPRAHGSYEALINDKHIDAVYIPLPNHLHVEWAIKAARAGKHVLCEKPIALKARDVERLIDARNRAGVLIQEAFMYRTQPAWRKAMELVNAGRIGELRAVVGVFSYFNADPSNIRNIKAWGGGGLYDIGCYLINSARWCFGAEPVRVAGAIERDPVSGVDTLASMLLEFPNGHATGVCSTQLTPYQRVTLFGSDARLEIEIPFNLPPDRKGRLRIDDGRTLDGSGGQWIDCKAADQYALQGDEFSAAILRRRPAPYPLEDSLANMRAIDAVFGSSTTK